jgi:hypothetical protein
MQFFYLLCSQFRQKASSQGVKKCNFDFPAVLWVSPFCGALVSKSTKIVLSYITPSLPLLLYLITFAKDTESNMAEDEQNYKHIYYVWFLFPFIKTGSDVMSLKYDNLFL